VIAVDFMGAAFVVEDGNETGNRFIGNWGAYTPGNGVGAGRNAASDCRGCEGSIFWLGGVAQYIERNRAWNGGESGYSIFNSDRVVAEPRDLRPLSFADNVAVANVQAGVEQWGTREFDILRGKFLNNGQFAAWPVNSGPNYMVLVDTILGAVPIPRGSNTAIGSTSAYTLRIVVRGGRVYGHMRGIERGGAIEDAIFESVEMQNVTNFWFRQGTGRRITLRSVLFKDVPGYPRNWIELDPGVLDLSAGASVPNSKQWQDQRGQRGIWVHDHQRQGRNYKLVHAQSHESAPAWPAVDRSNYVPEAGLNMLQAWLEHGRAHGGDVIRQTEIVQFDGLIGGYARLGHAMNWPVPRANVVYPNEMTTGLVPGSNIRVEIWLSGDPNGATEEAFVSLNGGDPFIQRRGQGAEDDERSVMMRGVSAGWQVIRTWRLRPGLSGSSAIVPGSADVGCFRVGEVDAGPPAACGVR
jgi:hypothetical protein